MKQKKDTAEKHRREVVERLLRAWDASPHLRLGQLLTRAMGEVLYEYVLDEELLGLLEGGMPKAERRKAAREFSSDTV
jgi:hypothetical protein